MPSYLMNGRTYSAYGSPGLHPAARTSVNAEERERLTASIVSSNARRQPIDLDFLEPVKANGHGSYPSELSDEDSAAPTSIDVSARDPRDEAPSQTIPSVDRPASPYTSYPPIDFDGLSWPSESWLERGCKIMLKGVLRSWDEKASRSHARAGERAFAEIGRSHNDHLGVYWRGSGPRGSAGNAGALRKSHAVLYQRLRGERS